MHTAQLLFSFPWGQGLHFTHMILVARGAVAFPLAVRTRVTLPALQFLPSMRASLDTHFSRATKLRAHALLRPRKRRGRSRGFCFVASREAAPKLFRSFSRVLRTEHESGGVTRRRGKA